MQLLQHLTHLRNLPLRILNQLRKHDLEKRKSSLQIMSAFHTRVHRRLNRQPQIHHYLLDVVLQLFAKLITRLRVVVVLDEQYFDAVVQRGDVFEVLVFDFVVLGAVDVDGVGGSVAGGAGLGAVGAAFFGFGGGAFAVAGQGDVVVVDFDAVEELEFWEGLH